MENIKTAAILIGGEGTRLRPLTIHKPKPLVPVAGRPLLEHMLLWLKKHGIEEVIFILFYQKEKLRKVFGNGSKLGLRIVYVEENMPRGTGGALRTASKFLKHTTIVLNGDTITDINISELISFHHENKSEITITLVPVEDPTAFGLVKTDKGNKILQFLEKPSWDEIGENRNINAGVYIIEPHIINKMPKNKIYSLERDLFPSLLKEKSRFFGFTSKNSYWLDLGTPDKYKKANYDIMENKVKAEIPYKELSEKLWINDIKNISKKSVIKKPVMIGKQCIIGDNTVIGEFTIIGNKCKIGKNVNIERSIIWDNVEIKDNAILNDCIIADNCKISDFVKVGKNTLLGARSKIPSYSVL